VIGLAPRLTALAVGLVGGAVGTSDVPSAAVTVTACGREGVVVQVGTRSD
jgi:hypothetical protein